MGFAVISADTNLDTVTCHACGILFGIVSGRYRTLRSGGETFFCPNGHPIAFVESELERTKKLLAKEEQRRKMAEETAQAEAKRAEKAETALDRTKATLKRERKRIGNGVCPCCSRTFVNLGRHMKTKHPEHPEVD